MINLVNIFKILILVLFCLTGLKAVSQKKISKIDSIRKAHASRLKKTLKWIEAQNKKNNRKKLKIDPSFRRKKENKNEEAINQNPLFPTDSSQKKNKGKFIQVIKSDIFRRIKIDSFNTINVLVGNVLMKQENSLFYCDSAIQNIVTNEIEAFGKVHINDSDSIHTYSDYLKYIGQTRIAILKDNVLLTDGKANLTTDELEYDLNAKLGTYLKGGKVVNGRSVLTSIQGYYYADTKDVYFQKNVTLVDPEYIMNTDTLLYNVNTEIASFLAITTIRDDKTRIKTRSGFYNLKTGKAKFTNRPILIDSVQMVIADNLTYDKISGEGTGDGNVFYRDSSQGISMLSGGAFFNTISKEVTSYRSPVLIMKQDKDNLYMAADTLYSAYQKIESVNHPNKLDSAGQPDSLNPKVTTDSIASKLDSSLNTPTDSVNKKNHVDTSTNNVSLAIKSNKDTTNKITTVKKEVNDSSKVTSALNNKQRRTDSLNKKDTLQDIDTRDSVRYFRGYHNVRMYSDSIQGKCDSLYYSFIDSVFNFYMEPVIWSNGNQISGDFLKLTTKNKQADQFIVDQNAISISTTGDGLFNQLRGAKMIGIFKDGEIDSILAIGEGQSLYYLQDEDSAYVGMDFTEASNIIMTFKNRELKKVIWVKDAKGTTYPFNKIPEDKRQLKNFRWLEAIRPKSAGELFGK
jgi:lipopolysaccharide export system protein LptA